MSGRVNTKFVIILAGSLVALVAAASALLYVSNRGSSARNLERAAAFTAEAEQLRAQGDEVGYYERMTDAANQYGSAVNKESSNVELLNVWVDALRKTRPPTDAEYEKIFNEFRSGIATIARVQPTDAEARLAALEFEYEFLTRRIAGANLDEPMRRLVDEISAALPLLPEDSEATTRVRGYRGLAQLERMRVTQVEDEDAELALEDLRLASGLTTDNDVFEFGVVLWHAAMTESLQTQGRTALSNEQDELAREALDALNAEDPGNLRGRALGFRVAMREFAQTEGVDRESLPERAGLGRAEIAEIVLSTPAEQIDRTVFSVLLSSEALPRLDTELMLRTLDHIRSGHPTRPEHILLSARHLLTAGRYNDVIEKLMS